jgi:hypothetical protein
VGQDWRGHWLRRWPHCVFKSRSPGRLELMVARFRPVRNTRLDWCGTARSRHHAARLTSFDIWGNLRRDAIIPLNSCVRWFIDVADRGFDSRGIPEPIG